MFPFRFGSFKCGIDDRTKGPPNYERATKIWLFVYLYSDWTSFPLIWGDSTSRKGFIFFFFFFWKVLGFSWRLSSAGSPQLDFWYCGQESSSERLVFTQSEHVVPRIRAKTRVKRNREQVRSLGTRIMQFALSFSAPGVRGPQLPLIACITNNFFLFAHFGLF